MKSSLTIFPIATTYPSFFNTNLVDPHRVIKLITGKYCTIRAFYYQYLKLVFEIDVKRQDQQIDYCQLLLQICKNTITSCPKISQQHQLKLSFSSIQKFLHNLSNTQLINFQHFLQTNIQIDQAFINIFTHILKQQKNQYKSQLNSPQQIFTYLCQIFKEHISNHNRCIKFQQSDVFVYVENENQLYLAFLNLQEVEDNDDNSIDKGLYNNTNKNIANKYEQKNNKKSGRANDTIMNIFGDMLHSSKNDGDSKISNSFVTNNLNISLSPPRKQDEGFVKNSYQLRNIQFGSQQHNIYQQRQGNNDKRKQGSAKQQNQVYRSVQYDMKRKQSSKFSKEQQSRSSFVQKYQLNKDSGFQNRQPSPQDTLYRPLNKLPTIHEVTASKQSLLYSKKYKRDPLDIADQQQKGTFYRQFTNTRILSMLPEPIRSNVKMLKNRFIGVHGVHGIHQRDKRKN